MKRIFLGLLSLLVLNTTTLRAQLTFEIISENQVRITECETTITSIIIPEYITFENDTTNYRVVEIDSNAFLNCKRLTSINIPNTVTNIAHQAFQNCIRLNTVFLPENATIAINAFNDAGKRDTINGVAYKGNDTLNIANYSFVNTGFITFYLGDETYQATEASVEYCDRNKEGAFVIPDSIIHNGNSLPVTVINNDAFANCKKLTSVTMGSNIRSIETEAFWKCTKLDSFTCFAATAPKLGSQVFNGTPTSRKLTIPFGTDYNSWKNPYEWKKTNYLIQENDTAILEADFMITNRVGLINNGVLRIPYGKQLIDTTNGNISGIIEVETDILSNSHWSFVGAPFSGYKLDAIKPGSRDVSVLTFDYTTEEWNNQWATIDTTIETGEGFILWSFAEAATVFTTKPNSEAENYTLNNTDLILTKQSGNWLALANPYTFKIDVSKFIADNQNKIQGQDGIYILNSSGEFQYITQGEINLTQGFFVNYANEGEDTVIFSKSQRQTNAKTEKKKEYITIKMKEGERESQLFFSLNPNAKTEYDIYDANKLFSLNQITEPYFLTANKALIKEEVNTLPYTAKINVKSYEKKEVNFRIDNIPSDIVVYLIDNGNDIKMNSGEEYNTYVVEGENADRFQLLVKKIHRIESIESDEITIKNNNREINIETQLENLNIKVFNAIGQEVFSTKERIFFLDSLPCGAYIIKVSSGRKTKTKKIEILHN